MLWHKPGKQKRTEQYRVEGFRRHQLDMPGELNSREHRKKYPCENEGIDEPGCAKQQCELHNVLGFEKEKGCPHEKQIEVPEHEPKWAATAPCDEKGREKDQGER